MSINSFKTNSDRIKQVYSKVDTQSLNKLRGIL